VIPTRFRRAMLDKHITRLVKSDKGGPTFETIDQRVGRDQTGGPRRRLSIWKRSLAFPPSAWPPWIVSRNWRWRRVWTPCAMPAFRW
jgi:hypothetical protein